MEDAKSGHLETTFGGKHKQIDILDVHIVVLSNNAPDLSVLIVDRWKLWRLGDRQYEIINFDESWLMKERDHLEKFCETTQYIKDLVTNMNNSPNYIKIKIQAMQFMESIDQDSTVDFT